MPWKPAAAAARIHRPRAGSKSIRGRISSPIPILHSLDHEPLVQDQSSAIPGDSGAIVNDAVVDDADAVARQTVESSDQAGTRYTSVSSRSTGTYTFQSQVLDATSSMAARTSISARSSFKFPSSARQSYPLVPDMDGTRDEKDGQGQQQQQQRKKSSIRLVLGKLFGRKNKSQQHKDDTATHLPTGKTNSAEPSISPPNQRYSDDPPCQKTPRSRSIVESKRSFSVPITEYDRALHSHSIGPEDVMAIQSARNSLSADFRLSGKCMSLLNSSTHPENPRWTCGSRMAGLSPRPASSQDQTFQADVNEDPSEIGRAISSDTRGLKRRSRSLTFMPSYDVVSMPSPPRDVVRRRSAEIRRWRDGHVAPLISPNRTTADGGLSHLPMQDAERSEMEPETEPEPEPALELQTMPEPVHETMRLVIPEPEPEPELESESELEPEPEPEPASESESKLRLPVELNPQSRSNSLHSSLASREQAVTRPQPVTMYQKERGEEKEPETYQAKSPARSIDYTGWIETTSLESRVSTLETRMSRLEGIVIQLGNSLSVLRPPSKDSRLEIASVGDRRHSVSRLSTCHSNTSKTTFGDVGEATPRATVVLPTTLLTQQQRRAAEEGTSHAARHVTLEHYTNMLALLETERSAREALESQVRSLGNQIHLISKTATYTSTDQSDSPSLDRYLEEMSVFDHGEEEDDHRHGIIASSRSPFTLLGLDDPGISTDIRTDNDYTESLVRSAETASSGLDAFGSGDEETKLSSCSKRQYRPSPTTKRPMTAMPQGAPLPYK